MRVTNLVATYCFKNRKWIRGEEKQAVMLDGFGMKRVPQHLLSRCPGFSVRSNWGKKPAACQGGFINNPTGPPANPLKVQLYKQQYKFLVCEVIPGRWALFTEQHEARSTQ